MRPALSSDPALDEIRLELSLHQRYAHALPGAVCETCLWLNRLEEDQIEAELARGAAA